MAYIYNGQHKLARLWFSLVGWMDGWMEYMDGRW